MMVLGPPRIREPEPDLMQNGRPLVARFCLAVVGRWPCAREAPLACDIQHAWRPQASIGGIQVANFCQLIGPEWKLAGLYITTICR